MKAIAFHASVRVRLSVTGKIKNKDKEIIGVSVKAQVVKNRLGPPFRTAEFNVYFDRGVDDLSSWMKVMKDKNLVKAAGAYVKYTDDANNEHQFQSGQFEQWLIENPELGEEVYQKICEAVIMSYKTDGVPSTEIEFEEGEVTDE